MKKLLLFLALLTAAVESRASDPAAGDFLTGTSLLLTNNTAYSFSTVGIIYSNRQGSASIGMVYSLTNIMLPTGITNATFFTNANIGAYPGAFQDVKPWSLRNGDVNNNAAISIAWVGDNANSSNTLTFRFARVIGGIVATNNSDNVFVFTTAANNLVNGAWATNLPTSFLQGNSEGVRLQNVTVSSVSSSTHLRLNYCRLTGFTP